MSEGDLGNIPSIERIHAPREAVLDASPKPRRVSVPVVMMLAVALGFVVGFMVGIVVAPTFGLVFGLGGAMSFGAGTVAVFLFRGEKAQPQGNARTEEEVRQALADIEARKK